MFTDGLVWAETRADDSVGRALLFWPNTEILGYCISDSKPSPRSSHIALKPRHKSQAWGGTEGNTPSSAALQSHHGTGHQPWGFLGLARGALSPKSNNFFFLCLGKPMSVFSSMWRKHWKQKRCFNMTVVFRGQNSTYHKTTRETEEKRTQREKWFQVLF